MKRVLAAMLVSISLCISVSAQVEEFYTFEIDNNYVYDILNSNGEFAYFVRLNQSTGIRGLWFTDGTEEGTSIISSDLNVFSTGRYDVGYSIINSISLQVNRLKTLVIAS